MTKEVAFVDPVRTDDADRPPQKPHVDDGKPYVEEDTKDLSEEDTQLRNELNMLVNRLKEPNVQLYNPSLQVLITLIRTSTSSMTSVPKPLKFLRPHFQTLKELHQIWKDKTNKALIADVISVLAMSFAEDGKRDTLAFCLFGTPGGKCSWGHEYVRHLATEIGEEYAMRLESKSPTDDLFHLANEIVPFFLSHNAEADAVDLLLELESIDKITPFVDENTFARVCLYMVSCVHYLPPPDDVSFLRSAHTIYRKVNKLPEALILSLRLNDKELIKEDYEACTDPLLRKQMAFLLARQAISMTSSVDEAEQEILCNLKLSEHFLSLGRELGISDPKTPEDIYKTHLETRSTFSIDSARQNLASSFVNAFVNAGFGKDKLMLIEDSQWVYKTKEHAMLSATASIGALMLWDVEGGLTQIDKYLYNSDEAIQAGALLAIGMVNANVKNESDPAMALLSEHLHSEKPLVQLMAITGLGLAYAGSENEAVYDLLCPLIKDTDEVSCTAALALGLVFVGTCHGDLSSTILQNLMEAPQYRHKTRFMALGLALLYLGKQEMCDATLETLRAVDPTVSKPFQVLLEICAYAGTGNVLKVQSMLQMCSDHLKENEDWQAFAVLGVALIAMGDDLGNEMALRIFNHFVHYCEPVIRRSVPLAISLLFASNPVLTVMDTLSKYSHDSDQDVAINAIFAMGIMGAGTNNARLAQMLRQLASYYHKNPDCLFFVRLAQGWIHMGKGTLTINPFHTNRMLMSRVGVAGLLTVLVSMTDVKGLILGKSHWLLYHLVSAMYPRFLITLDESLKPKAVSARVGMAVDVVGQAGRPKTITGFQTYTTPVLMAHTDRAELATDEFISLAPVLEGFVIIKKNPNYMETGQD